MEKQRTSNQFCFVIQMQASNGQNHIDSFGSTVSPESIPNRLQSYLSLTGCRFWYIVHNHDVDSENNPKRLHLHLVVHLGVSRRQYLMLIKEIANWCFIPTDAISVESVNNLEGCLRYLIHMDNPEKFQYSEKDVVTNSVTTFKESINAQEVYSASKLISICEVNNFDRIAVLRSIGLERYTRYRQVINDICQCGVALVQR